MSLKQHELLLKMLLIIQVFAIGLGFLIEYQTRNSNDFSGLIAALPYGIFSTLVFINSVYGAILSIILYKSKHHPES